MFQNRRHRQGYSDFAFSLPATLPQQALYSHLTPVHFITVHTKQNFCVMIKQHTQKHCAILHTLKLQGEKCSISASDKKIKPQGHELVRRAEIVCAAGSKYPSEISSSHSISQYRYGN